MRYAVFHNLSTGYVEGSIPPRFDGPKKPIPACGSDSVYVFDGRLSLANCLVIARNVCKTRRYIGFTIEQGDRFTTGRETRKLELIA